MVTQLAKLTTPAALSPCREHVTVCLVLSNGEHDPHIGLDQSREISMNVKVSAFATATVIALILAPAAYAQDAMSSDAMSSDASTRLTDEEYALCMEQASGLTFPAAQRAANAACYGLQQGMDVMGAIDELEMGGDQMASDPISTDAMAPDAMAPDAMAPAQ
jgi:hypothetical protein